MKSTCHFDNHDPVVASNHRYREADHQRVSRRYQLRIDAARPAAADKVAKHPAFTFPEHAKLLDPPMVVEVSPGANASGQPGVEMFLLEPAHT